MFSRSRLEERRSLRLLRRSRIKDCNCTVQAMFKAVDDANGCVESRLIAVLKAFRFLQTALLRLLFCGTAAAKFAIDSEKVTVVTAVTETSGCSRKWMLMC